MQQSKIKPTVLNLQELMEVDLKSYSAKELSQIRDILGKQVMVGRKKEKEQRLSEINLAIEKLNTPEEIKEKPLTNKEKNILTQESKKNQLKEQEQKKPWPIVGFMKRNFKYIVVGGIFLGYCIKKAFSPEQTIIEQLGIGINQDGFCTTYLGDVPGTSIQKIIAEYKEYDPALQEHYESCLKNQNPVENDYFAKNGIKKYDCNNFAVLPVVDIEKVSKTEGLLSSRLNELKQIISLRPTLPGIKLDDYMCTIVGNTLGAPNNTPTITRKNFKEALKMAEKLKKKQDTKEGKQI